MAAEVSFDTERRMAVAVDEGEESMYALRWFLVNLLPSDKTTRNTIILIYARSPPPVFSAMDGTARRTHGYITETDFVPDLQGPETGYLFSEEVVSSMEKYSRDLADSVMEKAKRICNEYANIKVEVKTVSGDARQVICEMVDKLGVDILVMGCHGYGFIKRALLGSVSDYCARNVKCPVVIVKRPANEAH